MKKIFTLFAILFAMVGIILAEEGPQPRKITVPSEMEGWYVYAYTYTTYAHIKTELEGYLEEDNDVLHSTLWTNDDYEYIHGYFLDPENPPYPFISTVCLGQVSNGIWEVPLAVDSHRFPQPSDPLLYDAIATLFMSNELPIAGTQWAIFCPLSDSDCDYTDLNTHCYASGVFGGNPATANEDPQNPGEFYTTYYDGEYDFTIATPGAEVYTVSVTGDIANLDPFTEYIIPANLPVLIKSPVADLTIARCDYWNSTTTVPSNALHGGPATVAANSVYTLAAEDNILAFYKYELTSIPAHKAYLQLEPGQSAPRRISFGTNATTGMENTEATCKAEKIVRNGQLLIKKGDVLYNAQGAIVK